MAYNVKQMFMLVYASAFRSVGGKKYNYGCSDKNV